MRLLTVPLAAAWILGWASASMAEFKTIEGAAGYREKIALPADAVLDVELRDISRADAPAPLLSAISVKAAGQVPIKFKLGYDDGMIDERFSYAVSAKLRVNNKVVFRSSTTHLVLTRGNPGTVDIIMEKIASSGMESSNPLSLFSASWLDEDIVGGGVLDRARTMIRFEIDGAVAGLGGCNRFTGRAKIEDQQLEVGPLAATRKACTPALMDQETKFFDAMAKVRSFEIDQATRKLVLKDETGAALVRFSAE
ncbi:MAG: YbaY family lipoprotein [Hyphomicrobium sp.]|nr:YbaY family lipoprotein [Hyphomicrobium sp.]